MTQASYLIALGSNRRHGGHGAPDAVLAAAIHALAAEGLVAERQSRIRMTPALGPAGRGFANGAILVLSDLQPPALLEVLKRTERAFGRRPGRRWGARVLDLDIILWSEGSWEEVGLIVPHLAFRARSFVLDPIAELAPTWRDPLTGHTLRQLRARLHAPRPVDRIQAAA